MFLPMFLSQFRGTGPNSSPTYFGTVPAYSKRINHVSQKVLSDSEVFEDISETKILTELASSGEQSVNNIHLAVIYFRST